MLIVATNIHKRYKLNQNEISVLEGADLSVDAGETVAVIGKSGAGKSTLLHILGGIERPDQGSGFVCIDGNNIYALSGNKRSRIRATTIGFVFQSYHLLNEMDVLENVILPARAIGAMTDKSRALELLDAVGVADRAHHTPMELSGGEQQRVALARALINNPAVILADEPTGNLDEETGGIVLELLFKLTKDSGHALVMVTHSKQIASTCDRTMFLEHGKLNGLSD